MPDDLLLANADMSWDKERTYLALFEEERVAGILLTPRPVHGEAERLRRRASECPASCSTTRTPARTSAA